MEETLYSIVTGKTEEIIPRVSEINYYLSIKTEFIDMVNNNPKKLVPWLVINGYFFDVTKLPVESRLEVYHYYSPLIKLPDNVAYSICRDLTPDVVDWWYQTKRETLMLIFLVLRTNCYDSYWYILTKYGTVVGNYNRTDLVLRNAAMFLTDENYMKLLEISYIYLSDETTGHMTEYRLISGILRECSEYDNIKLAVKFLCHVKFSTPEELFIYIQNGSRMPSFTVLKSLVVNEIVSPRFAIEHAKEKRFIEWLDETYREDV